MDDLKRYEIYYTETAIRDIDEKADYIAQQLSAPDTAWNWYTRLRSTIQEDLSYLPFKYPTYNAELWREKGVRILTTRTDVVLYSIDDDSGKVYIRAVCTRGRDLSAHLAETE